MTNNTSAGMNQFLTGSNPTDGTERQAGWLRGVVVVGVMTLLVLGMNPDGGRHIPVSALETNAKLILAVGIGMVCAGRFMARRTPAMQTA
jgi:hypothetical protein